MKSTTARIVALALLPASLAACSTSGGLLDSKIDYKSAGAAKQRPVLDVPPDIASPRADERFALPSSRQAATTLSQYQQKRGERAVAEPGATGVLPAVSGVRIERDGRQRWLVVDQPPERVWPVVREFWEQNGFTIAAEQPAAGVLETDWAEKRSGLRRDVVQRTIGSVLPQLFDTGERDKFRVRLEPAAGGKATEIYVSHRGLEEVLNQAKDAAVWTNRPSDPELEAEFLRRLMVRFGVEEKVAVARVAESAAVVPRARLEGGLVRVDEPFDRAWRRVGLALDRSGFTVEDRDRTAGTYFVRFVDDAEQLREEGGFFSRLFGGGPKRDTKARQFRIQVAAPAGAQATDVRVLSREGAEVRDASERKLAERIAKLLLEQLK